MEKHPEETKKTGVSVRKLFPALVAAAISFWFSGLYMNRLCAGLFASAALTKPEIIGAAAPFSYRIIARIIVGVALFTIPLVLIGGLKEKMSKWFWIIAIVLAIPQLHGKTCLYEDGRLVTSMPLGIVCCEHTLSEVAYAEIKVSGRSTVRMRHAPRIFSDLTMTLHIPCGNSEDIFVFSIEAFRGKEENDQLYQMVCLRNRLPSDVLSVEPYTGRALGQVLADERLEGANPALIKKLLRQPQ